MAESRWVFSASGQEAVVGAFRSIGRAAAESEGQIAKALGSMPRAAGRAAAKTTSVEDHARAKRIRALEQETQARQRRIEQAADREIRALERKLAHEERAERAAAGKRQRLRERDARNAARIQRRDSGRRMRALGSMGSRALTGIAGGAAVAAGVAGLAVRDAVRLDDFSTRLAIKGGRAGQGGAIRRQLENAAIATPGAKAQDVGAGVERFVSKTGNLDFGMQLSRTIAELSVATGTEAAELGGVMADLAEKFDIKTVEQMNASMAMLAVQGKRGAFELEDAAKEFPAVAAAASRFGLKGAAGLATLGGLTQIARSATPSGSEAATAVEQMFAQLVAKSDVIKQKTGASVFKDAGKTQTNRIEDVLVNTIAGAKGNQQLLNKIFDVRGSRAVSPLVSLYNETHASTKGTEDGKTAAAVKALRERIGDAIDATGAEAEIKRDLAAAQATTGAQLTAAWESIKVVAGNAAPHVASFAKAVANAVQGADFSGLVQGFNDVASGAAWLAEKLGLFKPADAPIKELTDEQLAKRQAGALEKQAGVRSTMKALQAKIQGGQALTDEELAQYRQLDQQDDALTKQAREAELEAGRRTSLDKQPLSPDDFVKGFVGAYGAPDFWDELDNADSGMPLDEARKARARNLARDVMSDPLSASAPGWANDEQRRQFDAFVQSQINNGGNYHIPGSSGAGATNPLSQDPAAGGDLVRQLIEGSGKLNRAADALLEAGQAMKESSM